MSSRSLDIQHQYWIRASRSKVYEALTNPVELRRWFLASAKIRPEPGTSYTFQWKGGHSHTAKVLEAIPDRRLTLSWPNRIGGTTHFTQVTFELTRKSGGTLLLMNHKGYPKARRWLSTYGGTEAGWAYFLTNLKSVLAYGHDLRSRHDR